MLINAILASVPKLATRARSGAVERHELECAFTARNGLSLTPSNAFVDEPDEIV
jgi:hypothetical protein